MNFAKIGSTPIENSTEFIEKINKIKEGILNGTLKSDKIEYDRKDVIESWLRSSHYGLVPKDFKPAPVLDPAQLKRLLQEKKFFIDIFNRHIEKVEMLLEDITFKIFVSDENGVIMCITEKGNRNADFSISDHHMETGSNWTEETVGTCAHGLCIIKGEPVHLIGPEHFSDVFKYTVAYSAPIFDINYNLIGTLNVAYLIPNVQSLNSRNVYTFWLANSFAQAVQNEIWMAARNEMMRAALNDTKEAVLTVNSSGIITHGNMAALALFQLERLNGKSIFDLLELPSSFLSSIDGEIHKGMVVKCKGIRQKKKLISAQLVKSDEGVPHGYVLKFDIIRNRTQVKSKNQSIKFNFGNIIGEDPRWNRMISQLKKFSKTDANILLLGESGSGKDVLAQAIHNNSRPKGPFMAINCAAISSSLIESELFGYEGGSFTGAIREGRPGKIEMANNGTLFLDEIGDMPMDIQPTLLRVLEDKKVMRVGGSEYIDIDFRLVAATNQNLLQLVKEKKFREDLYYRLAVFKMAIPPLRERGADIIRLARHFIEIMADKQQIIPPILSDDAIYCLLHYTWPGNVRELRNAILYAMNTFVSGIIRQTDLPMEISGLSTQWDDYGKLPVEKEIQQPNLESEQNLSYMETVEKRIIMQALINTNHNIGKAADEIGISRSTLYRKIRLYNIPSK